MPFRPLKPAGAPPIAPLSAPAAPASAFGIVLAIAVASLIFGRLIEFLPGIVALMRPAVLLLGSAMLVSLLSGRIFRIAASPISVLLLGFTFWSAIGIPVSVWRGGALNTWSRYWLVSLLAYITMATLVDGLPQCRKVIYAIAVSMLALLGLGLFLGAVQTGAGMDRYAFEGGTLGNANLVAMVLLMGLPFSVFAVRWANGPFRLLFALGSLGMAASIFRTGSRAGIVTLLLLGIVLLVRLPARGRFALAMAGIAAAAAGISLSTESALDRFRVLLRSGKTPASEAEASAMESSRLRAELLRRSLVQTARHPLLGVGTGMFMVADDKLGVVVEQHRGAWRVSHNGYTQLSSETGIPGALLYIAAVFLCLRTSRAIWTETRRTPEHAQIADMALALGLSVMVFAVQMCFSSSAYEAYFPILAGLTVAFEAAAREEIRRRNVPAPRVVPAPAVPWKRRRRPAAPAPIS